MFIPLLPAEEKMTGLINDSAVNKMKPSDMLERNVGLLHKSTRFTNQAVVLPTSSSTTSPTTATAAVTASAPGISVFLKIYLWQK